MIKIRSQYYTIVPLILLLSISLQSCVLDLFKKKENDPNLVEQYVGRYQMNTGQLSCSTGDRQNVPAFIINVSKGAGSNQIVVEGLYDNAFTTTLNGNQFSIPSVTETDANLGVITATGLGTFSGASLAVNVTFSGQGFQCNLTTNGSK